MTRTFDSGLAGPEPTLIRNAVITLLAPMLRTATPPMFAMAIKPFPFAIKSYVNDDYELNILLDVLDGCSPAYAVCVGDSTSKRTGGRGTNLATFEVEVYSYSDHMRHLVLGRLEADATALQLDTTDPGIEVMRTLARMYLMDQSLGPTLGTRAAELRYHGDRHLLTNRECSLWASLFTVDVNLVSDMHRGADEFVTEILTKHRIGAGDPPDPTTVPLITTLTDLT